MAEVQTQGHKEDMKKLQAGRQTRKPAVAMIMTMTCLDAEQVQQSLEGGRQQSYAVLPPTCGPSPLSDEQHVCLGIAPRWTWFFCTNKEVADLL